MSTNDFMQLVESIDNTQYAEAYIEVNGEVTHEFI
jgi:hypothetical protein